MYFPKLAAEFTRFLEAVRGQSLAVIGHMRPDGDCIGSQVALCRVLRASGVAPDTVCLNNDVVPRLLRNFIGDTPFHNHDTLAFEPARQAVHVDCAEANRTGMQVGQRFPKSLAMVDHHLSNPRFAEINMLDTDACATAEILAGLFLDHNLPIDAVTAQALYLGIATDTGQFRHSGVTGRTFEITGRLLQFGADPVEAGRLLYDRETRSKMELLQKFLATLRYEHGGKLCYGVLNEDVYKETKTLREDSEGLVDYTRSIDGVEIGAFLEERKGKIKGSLRAKTSAMRVDLLAGKFGGGGHAAAAGFNTDGKLADFLPRFLTEVKAHLAKYPES